MCIGLSFRYIINLKLRGTTTNFSSINLHISTSQSPYKNQFSTHVKNRSKYQFSTTIFSNSVMAPELKDVFETCYPVERSIIQHLNRSDFMNLRLAGIQVSTSATLHRNQLIPTGCDQYDDSDPDNEPWHRCENNSRDTEIRPCDGCIEPVPTEADSDSPTKYFPSKCGRNLCLRCRDRGIHNLPTMWPLGEAYARLCTLHNADQLFTQQPENSCRCLKIADIDVSRWRCDSCLLLCRSSIHQRVLDLKWDLQKGRDPSTHPGEILEMYQECPIPGCDRPAYYPPVPSPSLIQCLGCSAIFSTMFEG